VFYGATTFTQKTLFDKHAVDFVLLYQINKLGQTCWQERERDVG